MKKCLLALMISILLVTLFSPHGWASDKRHHRPKWYEFWKDHDKHHHDDKHEHSHERKYSNRRFYKSHRISTTEAKQIVVDSFPHWRLGTAWQGKHEKGLIVSIVYQGKIIGELTVHPVTGKILADEAKLSPQQSKIPIAQARKIVQQALLNMTIGNKIRLGKHSSFWEVPLLFNRVEVEEIRVGTGTGDILPDWHIEEEAYKYRH